MSKQRHAWSSPILFALALALLPPSASAMTRAVDLSFITVLRDGLMAPTALVADDDRIALLEPYARRLVILDPDGGLVRKIDLSADPGSLDRLDDSTYLLIDRDSSQVMSIDLHGSGSRVFLAGRDPVDIVVDGETCFILDALLPSILVTDPTGRIIEEIVLEAAAALESPASIARDDARDLFHVLDQRTARVLTFTRTGAYRGEFCSFGEEPGSVSRGGELACDRAGWVYLSDRFQGRVAVFDAAGEFVLNIDPLPLDEEMLRVPIGIAVDEQGLVYVASTEGNCVQVFHLAKLPLSIAELGALPLFPFDLEQVPQADLRLVATLMDPAAIDLVSGLDFRLMADADSTRLIEEVSNLPLLSPPGDEEPMSSPVAVWRTETSLDGDAIYGWQVRARGEGGTGPWSVLFQFSTEVPAPVRQLGQNYPNPFNPLTTIPLRLPEGERAMLAIYDLRGKLVWRRDLVGSPTASQEILWRGRDSDGNPVASGIFFYRLRSNGFEQTRKLVLVR